MVIDIVDRLVVIDSDWVPHDTSSSLYIRPTMIGLEPTLGVAPAEEARLFVLLCPVGPYYSTGFKPVNLLCDPSYVRAWPGGCGFTKMGSNYAPTLWVQKVIFTLSSGDEGRRFSKRIFKIYYTHMKLKSISRPRNFTYFMPG